MEQKESQHLSSKHLKWNIILLTALAGLSILVSCDENSLPMRQLSSVQQAPKDVDLFCEAVRGTGMGGCSVREAEKEIATFINTSNAEAIKICRGMIQLSQSHTEDLSGWRLNIYSVLNRQELLASCMF